jgi:hypothetical protein
MTGSVAQYVADGVTPERLREVLGPRFDIDLGPPETVDRTYLDTFDGLLHQADLTLLWQARRLVLSDGQGRELAAADWRGSSAPVRVADLPAGELRESLRPVIGVRAACPLVRLRIRRPRD